MKGGMVAVAFVAGLIVSPASAEKPVQGTGFICRGSDGTVKRLNIDLKKRRWDDGMGSRPLDGISDTTLTLKGLNPDLAGTDNGGMGPIFASLTLDRSTLILHDDVMAPNRGINRKTEYQCQMGPPVDFAIGRKF